MMKANQSLPARDGDRRDEHRFKPNQDATLKVSGSRPGPIMQASVLDRSGSGMRLRTPLPVPRGTAVEIHMNETLAGGTVCRCEPDNVSYTVGVRIFKTLNRPGKFNQ